MPSFICFDTISILKSTDALLTTILLLSLDEMGLLKNCVFQIALKRIEIGRLKATGDKKNDRKRTATGTGRIKFSAQLDSKIASATMISSLLLQFDRCACCH